MTLFAITVYSFACDVSLCAQHSDEYVPRRGEGPEWARKRAEAAGWTFPRGHAMGQAHCPEHSAVKR